MVKTINKNQIASRGVILLGKHVRNLTGALIFLFAQQPALSGDWELTDRLNVGVGFSDNIRQNDSKDTGTAINIRPNLTLIGRGGRVSGRIAYSPSMTLGLGGESSDGLAHFLNADVASELYEDRLFVNARATAGLTSRSGDSSVGLDGVSNAADDDDSTQTYTFAIAPELRNRFGTYADTILRLNLDTVRNENSSDSDGAGLAYSIFSGRQFPVYPWALVFDATRIDYDDRTDERMEAFGNVGYQLDNNWLFRFSAGVEKNDVDTTRSNTDGFIWGIGSVWTPNPRTSLVVDYAQRYFGPDVAARFSHETRRTRFTAAYTRTVSNSRQDQLNSTYRAVPGLDDSPYVQIPGSDDLLTEIPTGDNIDNNEDFLLHRFSFGVFLTGKRSTVSTQFISSKRSSEVDSSDYRDTYNFRVDAFRRLDQYFNVNGSFDWQRTEESGSDDRERYQFVVGINRNIGRKSSIGLGYSHLHDDDFSAENRIFATFSTSFL